MNYENPVHYCNIVQQRRFLEVCQHLVVKRKETGPLNECYFTCSVAINKHRCPVVKQLFPKKGDVDVSTTERNASDKGGARRTGTRSASKPKPRKVSSGNGHKEPPVRKEKQRGDGVLLPSLRKQGVPKNNGKMVSGKRKTGSRTKKGNT